MPNNTDLDSADRPFDNIINFRDVGKTINAVMGKRVMKEGALYRSARLDEASERDKRRLIDELHVSTVIDLRSVTEHRIATQKHRTEQNQNLSTSPESDSNQEGDTNEHLIELPGINRALISLTGKAWERALLWRLDWGSFFKVLALLAAGYRMDAVKIVCEQVMGPRGLIGVGQDTLDYSTAEMREVFEILADSHAATTNNDNAEQEDTHQDTGTGSGSETGPERRRTETYPLVLHCTQGKDRTGLIVLLLLLLTRRVPDSAIADDYMRSEREIVPEIEERLKETRAMGIPDDFVKCPEGFTGAIRGYLEERYGGVEGYLEGVVGVGRDTLERIRRVLLA